MQISLTRLAVMVLLLGVGGVPIVSAAPSQDAPARSGPTTVADIIRINEEIALMEAELRRLTIKSEIEKKKAEMGKPSSSGMAMPPMMMPPPTALPPPKPMAQPRDNDEPRVDPLPFVRGLEGVDGKLRATLAYSNGSMLVVSVGDYLHAEWRVDRITESAVTVSKGGQKRQLVFGREVRTGAGQRSDSPMAAF